MNPNIQSVDLFGYYTGLVGELPCTVAVRSPKHTIFISLFVDLVEVFNFEFISDMFK
jgi:hypothetical protein